MTLDTDGDPLPSDWYLRLAREAQKALRKTKGHKALSARSAS